MPLHTLSRPTQLLISAALVMMLAGIVVSEVYVHRTLEPADGRPGLSLDDITFTYHGDRSASPLTRQARGPMKRYFSALEDPRRLSANEQADLDRLVAWSDSGAPEGDYWDLQDRRGKPGPIYRLLDRHRCFDCHSPVSTTIGHKRDSPLNTYAAIVRFTQPDTGIDSGRLLMLSHVHLFGIGLLLFGSGWALAAARVSPGLKTGLILAGPIALLLTVGGWWGVKLWGAALAWVVLLGGVGLPLVATLAVGLSLFDMWRGGA